MSSPSSEPPQPSHPAAQQDPTSNTINIKLKDLHSGEIFFRIKATTKFERVFDAYCQRTGRDLKTMRFLFDGDRVQPYQTPEELEMEDSDCVDFVNEQLGG